MLYFTADWHWGDERLELLGRPFSSPKQAQDVILAPLLDLKADDWLYVNGDAAIDEEWLKAVNLIPCKNKILIKGNYDKLPDDVYLNYFTEVCEQVGLCSVKDPITNEFSDLHIVHYPSKSIERAFNIVGHIHGCWKVQKNMLNVGVDQHHFRPVSLEKVFFYKRAVTSFYDQDVWVADHPANVAFKERGKAGTYWQSGFGGTRGT